MTLSTCAKWQNLMCHWGKRRKWHILYTDTLNASCRGSVGKNAALERTRSAVLRYCLKGKNQASAESYETSLQHPPSVSQLIFNVLPSPSSRNHYWNTSHTIKVCSITYYHLTKSNKTCKNYNIIIIKLVRITPLSDCPYLPGKK